MASIDMALAQKQGRRIRVVGTVQGVGFRPWVYRLARAHDLTGRVHNDTAGVTIEAFGDREALDRFAAGLRESPPPAARIRDMRSEAIPVEEADGFAIVASRDDQPRVVSIPADLATCPACEAEIFDPDDRRFRYPFTNCTDCGPRFTIALDVPYDRPKTSMASFRMCAACQREYDDPSNRRFHAQPNACPACGPHLVALDAFGEQWSAEEPIRAAARAVEYGLIVAVKGLGGFHLACDARSSRAVTRLRARKRRDEKPFAVMVRDLAAAEMIAGLSDAERRLLTSVERPIVLAERRPNALLAPEIAPRNTLVGLMLPYTPLHHLLLARVDGPLVMTSGNLSEEPLAHRNTEALDRLGGIADVFLVHDRPIVSPCDDSVARIIAGRPVVFRRSRGYVPRPISLARPVARPVLACGALLKNTCCFARDGQAWLGPHIGDLENADTYRAFEEAIDRLQRFLGITPEIVAHDLHPEYLSTRYALDRPEPVKIAVQHHHAHAASAMAEHGLPGPVLAVTYDGTGYGTDGTAWGGELLLAEYERFEHIATFHPIALAGGDRAVREPWRLALALLEDAFEGDAPLDALEVFKAIPETDRRVVRRMIAARANAPAAHGVGRYFDAFGAFVLNRPTARYEGQIALELNLAADPGERGQYPFVVRSDRSPWVVDLRQGVRDAVFDLLGGKGPGVIAARIHNTIAAATADLLDAASRLHGRLPVVLTGGCFQNARLTESVIAGVGGRSLVFTHGDVPPGDGGLALGQAVVADAIARRLGA